MVPLRIEEASLNAWPALQQILFDGWVLRFARGYTKRANSVNPLFGSRLDLEYKVEVCEKLYQEKDLPTIFRLMPFAQPPGLDSVLEGRRYRVVDPTLVLYLDLQGPGLPDPDLPPRLAVRSEGLDEWLEAFCRLRGSPLARQQTHREMLEAIASRRILASLADEGRVVACALGVLEHDHFGLFDLITAPGERNKGYGRLLVSRMLRWARERGGEHAYLQVMRTNAPARHLYARLGFRKAYSYWYRVAEAQGDAADRGPAGA